MRDGGPPDRCPGRPDSRGGSLDGVQGHVHPAHQHRNGRRRVEGRLSALGPKAERRLRSVWNDLEATQEVFVIWTKSKNDGRLIFVEVEDHFIPEEADEIVSAAFAELLAARADIVLPQEAVIRLFTNEDEAGFYMETVG